LEEKEAGYYDYLKEHGMNSNFLCERKKEEAHAHTNKNFDLKSATTNLFSPETQSKNIQEIESLIDNWCFSNFDFKDKFEIRLNNLLTQPNMPDTNPKNETNELIDKLNDLETQLMDIKGVINQHFENDNKFYKVNLPNIEPANQFLTNEEEYIENFDQVNTLFNTNSNLFITDIYT